MQQAESNTQSPDHPYAPATAVSHEQVRAQLAKIIQSRVFAASARMSAFLRFAVEHALSSPPDRLKENVIGVEVFGRNPEYDPQSDPIVRVEARRLRAKLKAYYESEGGEDLLLIDLPKGTYTAAFRTTGGNPDSPDLTPEGTIAVLPFADLSGDASNEYFSDGLTEELIHALTKVDGLKVVAWHSAAQLKGRQQDIQGISDQLKVRYVLRGSVRRDSKCLRITAQLILTATGHYLWSEAYDREPCDLFSVQEEIACKIVNTLQLRLIRSTPLGQTPLISDPECYNLYLQGRFHWNKRTHEGLLKSIGCFEAAVARNNSCAKSFAGLADAYSLMTEYGFIHPAQSMQQAKTAALKALEADPSSAEACVSLALIRSLYEWNWTEGEKLYRRAIQVNHGYATAHHWFAVDYLGVLGRMNEAMQEIEIAHQLDPLSAIIREGRAFLRMLSRQYNEALELYREILEFDPLFYKTYGAMGRVYTQQGNYEEAIRMFEKGRQLAGDVPSLLGALGQACALAGRKRDARLLLDRLTQLSALRYAPRTTFAIIHLGLGEIDQALRWLERSCDDHELPITGLKIHPVYDPLRSEPAFQALLQRVGFID